MPSSKPSTLYDTYRPFAWTDTQCRFRIDSGVRRFPHQDAVRACRRTNAMPQALVAEDLLSLIPTLPGPSDRQETAGHVSLIAPPCTKTSACRTRARLAASRHPAIPRGPRRQGRSRRRCRTAVQHTEARRMIDATSCRYRMPRSEPSSQMLPKTAGPAMTQRSRRLGRSEGIEAGAERRKQIVRVRPGTRHVRPMLPVVPETAVAEILHPAT